MARRIDNFSDFSLWRLSFFPDRNVDVAVVVVVAAAAEAAAVVVAEFVDDSATWYARYEANPARPRPRLARVLNGSRHSEQKKAAASASFSCVQWCLVSRRLGLPQQLVRPSVPSNVASFVHPF